jgi:hypothetical protein
MFRDGGTMPTSGPGSLTFTRYFYTVGTVIQINVPGDAQKGKTFIIKTEVDDRRTATDPRHDPVAQGSRTWEFEIADECPQGIVVDAYDHKTPATLPGGTSDSWAIVTHKTTGPPPANPNRTNWNGTSLVEVTTPTEGDPNKFDPRAIGIVFQSSGFTIRRVGDQDNRFTDEVRLKEPWMVLKSGVANGDLTYEQMFVCKPAAGGTYAFTVKHAFQRQGQAPNDYCKGVVSKTPL